MDIHAFSTTIYGISTGSTGIIPEIQYSRDFPLWKKIKVPILRQKWENVLFCVNKGVKSPNLL
jgi:hypothetical protein